MGEFGRLAQDVDSVPDLGVVLSAAVGRLVGHDGYMLVGIDPVTGAFCLYTGRNGYSQRAYRQWLLPYELTEPDPHRVDPVRLLGPEDRDTAHRHELMAADGIGTELRIALRQGGLTWGFLFLVRERGSRPFAAEEAAAAQRIAGSLADALKQLVTGMSIRPMRADQPPGVTVLDRHDAITVVSSSMTRFLDAVAPDAQDDETRFGWIWAMAMIARRGDGRALCRVPSPQGWLSMHAEALDDGGVLLTMQPARADVLLPAMSRWYDITAREQSVLTHLLEGLATKQIARRLELSPHTVNDYLKSIYRKTRVAGRDELLATLSR